MATSGSRNRKSLESELPAEIEAAVLTDVIPASSGGCCRTRR